MIFHTPIEKVAERNDLLIELMIFITYHAQYIELKYIYRALSNATF